MFSEVKDTKGSSKWRSGGTLGTNFGLKGALLGIGAPLWLQVRLWSAQSDVFPPWMVVEGGPGKRFAAEAGPLELKLRELCIELAYASSTPCYL